MDKTLKTFIYITLGLTALVLISGKLSASSKIKGKNIVVGDSHAVMIGEKIKNGQADPILAKSGWNVKNVLNALVNYPVSPDVANVFISIGTNSGFNSTDKIEQLIQNLEQKFPNATLYAFRGSYGWSGRWENPNAAQDQIPYYQRFEDLGVTILDNGLGYFPTDAKAHSTSSPQAKAIIEEINSYTTN